MPGRVILSATEGPNRGEVYVFESHDVFIFGRDPECHACLGGTDTSASRQHFLLEVSPPAARVRDLGSRNGTFVNERQIVRGDDRRCAEVDLVDGDVLRVGTSAFRLTVEPPVRCERCKREIRPESADAWCHPGATHVCIQCRVLPPRVATTPVASPAAIACRHCGLEVGEAGEPSLQACAGCMARWADDPLALLDGPAAIPGFVVDRVLARDPSGASYLGRRTADGSPAAIKLMLARTRVSPSMREAFFRDVALVRALHHPNLLTWREHGSIGPVFWSATEPSAGSVADAMAAAGGRLALAQALPLARTALAGLAYLHEHNVVHGDVRPDNLLVAGPDVARIADAGLARSFVRAGLSGMTRTGATAVATLPREQLLHFKAVRPQADVFGFGATLYAMLTGRSPREESADTDPLLTVLRAPSVPIRQRDPQLPAALAAVVDRACAPAWKDRHAHAGELLADLERAL